MSDFYGRQELMGALKMLWSKRNASLVTCRGRRRIGKSTLIEEFARRSGAFFIKIEGLRPKPGLSNKDELAYFASSLSRQTGCDRTCPVDWLSAFARLDREIPDGRRAVVLLDEISWMAYYDKTFPEVLKTAWDDLFKKHAKLVLVLCGSVAMWIKENIIDNGAFAGRRSYDFSVPELPLSDCVKFWGAAANRENANDILDVLSVTGGVPRYLEEINPALSADENIRRLAYFPKSVLAEDFEDMFRDVITGEPGVRADILRSLVGGPKNVSEIFGAIGKKKNGHLSSALAELAEAGFIVADSGLSPETGKSPNSIRYRIKDNYVRFYLRYIEPFADMVEKGSFSFTSLDQLGGWKAIEGLAFENLVVNNFREFLAPLGLERTLVVSAAPFRKVSRSRGEGVQVDLLLQTALSVYFVEIKRQSEIGREVIDEMTEKVRRIRVPRGKTVKTALVYSGELAPIVEAQGYFNAVIDIRDILF